MKPSAFLAKVRHRFASRPDGLKAAYYFDAAGMEARFVALNVEGGGGVGFLAAVKAFPHADALALCARAGLGFDVSNATELALAEPFLGPGARVQLCGPGWSSSDVSRTLSLCEESGAHAVCVAENETQVTILTALGARWGRNASAGLRVNLGVVDPALTSRFGFDGSAIAVQLATLSAAGWTTLGLQAHDGLRVHSADTYLELARALTAPALRGPHALAWLSLGGGLHFLCDDARADVLGAARAIVDQRVGPEAKLTFEPGAFLSSGLGAMATEIVGSHESQEGLQVLVAVSAEAHLKWSKPRLVLPQLRTEQSLATRERPQDSGPVRISLLGSTCFEADRIGSYTLAGGRAALDGLLSEGFCVLGGVNGYSYAWQVGFNGTGSYPCYVV